jgi:ATP-dependent Lhr-like helicase
MKDFPAFHQYYPQQLVRWVKSRGWSQFTPIQEAAIGGMSIDPKKVLSDIILEAETASGKTEAAFLPLLARASRRPPGRAGFVILYISPLKALINDQEGRLTSLAEAIDLEVHPWHSEVESSKKTAARKSRKGILLTTPESLEGFFTRARTDQDPEIDAITQVDAVVIDELHSFLDTARGRHLQSLLHRLDQRATALNSSAWIPRIGLSATLGDIDKVAGKILRPKSTKRVKILRPAGPPDKSLTIRVRAFLDDRSGKEEKGGFDGLLEQYAEHLNHDFKKDRRGLVFTNSRSVAEQLQERAAGRANNKIRYKTHHSSVPSAERKLIEREMREPGDDRRDRLVAICTSTLELGIDIGKVHRVIQIDPTYTVAALRQRIGRSGRRGGLDPEGVVYVGERALTEDAHPLDRLRLRTFQAIATAQLSLEGQFEEPNLEDLHLSTLYHQIQSILHERGSETTDELYKTLVGQGPWSTERELGSLAFFTRFLEAMAAGRAPVLELVEANHWRILATEKPRRVAYAVFRTPPEYAVMRGKERIGHLPMTVTFRVGETFVLRGGRWRILNVNDEIRTIQVTRAPTAGAPRYGGTPQAPSGLVANRMRQLLASKTPISEVIDSDNPTTITLIEEGRKAFQDYKLGTTRFLEYGSSVFVFPWCGARRVQTLTLALRCEGLRASIANFAISVEGATTGEVKEILAEIAKAPLRDPDELARESRQTSSDRFDRYLTPYYQRLAFARRFLSETGLVGLVETLIGGTEFKAG